MAGLGCKIGDTTVGFDDLTPEAWARVGRLANQIIVESHDTASGMVEKRATWLDAYSNPLMDPGVARAIHEEAIKVAEPDVDAQARSRELVPSIRAFTRTFVEVPDDIPPMEDGRPLAVEAETSTQP